MTDGPPGGPGVTAPGLAFVLLVAPEPGEAFERDKPEPEYSRFRAFVILNPSRPYGPGAGSSPADPEPWAHLAPEMSRCVRLTEDIARRARVPLRVVNATEPGADRTLVERWVTPETMFPLLVAPDGRTLEGLDAFVPRALDEFIRGGLH